MSKSHPGSESGFDPFDLDPSLRRGIAGAGFTSPRPIQQEAIPPVLAGRDLLGLAQTGTGKTAAFALPMLQKLLGGRRPGPRALVLAPTRELASQISAEIALLGRHTPVKVATVFGGVSARPQITALKARPDIVVACPGRLLDLMSQGALRLDGIEVLVVDEADHMFDMGFLPDVRRILNALPARRQNLMFSATMPAEIRTLADRVLRDPVTVDVARSQPLATIEHALYPVAGEHKLDLLNRLLAADDFVSAIVFTRTKHRARSLAKKLSSSGLRAVALQGNMSQNQRDRAMGGFRKRQYDVLVATDIAARGIDVEQVSHVVNFDMPGTTDAYTHRIGRTGRAEREGKAYTFVTSDDLELVAGVERRMGKPIPRREVAGIPMATLPRSGAGQGGGGARSNGSGHRDGSGRSSGSGPSRGSGRGSSSARSGSPRSQEAGAAGRSSRGRRRRGGASRRRASRSSRGPAAG